MSELQTILIVEDDPVQRLLIVDALSLCYRLVETADGESVTKLVIAEKPCLVLMDIRLPGIDGYEACRQLRDDLDVGETPVLFLSAEINLPDRLAAYAAGGEDFIPKPFDPIELLAKVNITLAKINERQRLAGNAREAFQTAMLAMSSSSELGVVIQSLRSSFNCHDLVALADVLLGACRDFGLDACVRLQTASTVVTRNMDGETTANENGALKLLSCGDRIVSLGRQSAYNYGGVTVLIKGMPVADPERMGRLRDNLALVAEGCEARLHAIAIEMTNATQKVELDRLIKTSFDVLAKINIRHSRQRLEAQSVLTELMNKVEDEFLRLGLTDSQEAAVAGMVRNATYHVFELFDEGLDVENHIAEIRSGLDRLT
jgi:CheY-like chemotaxis protein